jgi:hypothetical protein
VRESVRRGRLQDDLVGRRAQHARDQFARLTDARTDELGPRRTARAEQFRVGLQLGAYTRESGPSRAQSRYPAARSNDEIRAPGHSRMPF